METNINIAEILKNKPQGTKLYSSACGKCQLEEVDDKSFKISFYSSKFGFMNGGEGYLDKNGKLYDDGECVVFPSKEMRDWSKFAWKKGDVLVLNEGIGKLHVIFEGFNDDTYTTFKGKHYLCNYGDNEEDYNDYNKEVNLRTIVFKKDDMNDAQTYINAIEEKLGGKLNIETLEIEKYPEFKDWDFITIKLHRGSLLIGVFKAENDKKYYLHAYLDSRGMITICEDSYCEKSTCIARLSTEEEKQYFFDALAKKGKTWEVEKKLIVDGLKTLQKFKPFDKVIVRLGDHDTWKADFYSHYCTNGEAYTVGGVHISDPRYILPYEGNESLLGTANSPK